MATHYNRKGNIITPDRVNSIQTTGATILSQGVENSGSFYITVQHDLSGCGGADTGVYVELRDFMPWTKISAEFWLLGTASCWSFNTSGYGNAVGNGGTGNLLAYDTSLGDRCVKTYLAQNDTGFTTHNPVTACDNNADNFMIYNGSVYRKCTFIRRRNVGVGLAGAHHGRSCNSTGSGSITIIKNIVVW